MALTLTKGKKIFLYRNWFANFLTMWTKKTRKSFLSMREPENFLERKSGPKEKIEDNTDPSPPRNFFLF